MIPQIPLLSLMMLTPLVGALLLMLLPLRNSRHLARISQISGLFFTVVTMLLSFYATWHFSSDSPELQWEERIAWIPAYDIFYHVGMDGISLVFVLLTTILIPLCLLAGFGSITHRIREYTIHFLILEACILGVFIAQDALLFYIYFEAVLIPMFFIIGIWGGGSAYLRSHKVLSLYAGWVCLIPGSPHSVIREYGHD